MIIPNYFPIVGGTENQLRGLVTHLKDDYNIEILTQRYNRLKCDEFVDGIKVRRIRSIPYLGILTEFFNALLMFRYIYVNQKKIDIIHFHQGTLLNALISILNYKFTGIKSICKIANSGEKFDLNSINFPFEKQIKKAFIKSINLFVILNDDIKKQLNQIHSSKTINIPNGVNLMKLNNSKFEYPRKIIFSSRLVPQKNIEAILNYLCHIENNLKDFEINIYGNGPEYDKLFSIGKSFKKLKFKIIRDSRKPYINFKYGDIFINSSSYEGISNSLLEAMSCGLVPLVSNIPGNLRVIEDGFNGFSFNFKYKDSFLKSLNLIINSDKLYKEISKKSYETIEKEFDFSIVVKKYKLLYKKLINEGSQNLL